MFFGLVAPTTVSSRETRESDSDFNSTTTPNPLNVTDEVVANTTAANMTLITNSTAAGSYLHLEVLKASFSLVLAKIDTARREIIAYQAQSEAHANQLRLELLLAVGLSAVFILLACYSRRLCNILGRCSRNCGRVCIASTTKDDDERQLAGVEEQLQETFIYYTNGGEPIQFTQEDIRREVNRQALRNLRAQFDPIQKDLTGSVNSAFTTDGSRQPTAKKTNKEEGGASEPSQEGPQAEQVPAS